MGRKLPFLPTCGSPRKTLSFRAVTTASAITGDLDDKGMTQETESSIESVIQGLSSDRFFFNPGKTNSILEEAKAKEKQKQKQKDVTPFKENVSMMEMESTDPYVDFKKSMQEMVEADEGLKQWDNLQELLSMYLSLNDKINHGYIIRAFVDILLVNLGPSSSSSTTSTSSSCSSSINGQEQSILLNGSSSSNSNSNSNNKTMMLSTHESPESAVSFTSSSASTSETCSSTSHCLSSCSLEDDDDNHEDDEDLSSPQKVAVSDDVS